MLWFHFFCSFLSRHHPSPSSGPPHFIIEFVYPLCWLIVFLLASFGNLKKIFFVPYLIFLFQFARLQNDRFPDWRFHFYNYFFPSHSLAAIFSVCNLGKINNYQIMINYIIHYIHGGSQTIKKIRTSPFSFLGLRKKERIKWNKLNLKKKNRKKKNFTPVTWVLMYQKCWDSSTEMLLSMLTSHFKRVVYICCCLRLYQLQRAAFLTG